MEAEDLAIREDDGVSDDEVRVPMEDLLCPICWELLHRPHRLDPCNHVFCEPCLRRLVRAGILTCPLCRSFITDSHLDEELHSSIENQHQDVYMERQQVEMTSGIFNEPLPPMRRTLAENFNERREGRLTTDLALIAMVILVIIRIMVIIPFGNIIIMMVIATIIIMLNRMFDQTEEYLAVAIYESLRPMMRVVTFAKLIFRLMSMIIQLILVHWLCWLLL